MYLVVTVNQRSFYLCVNGQSKNFSDSYLVFKFAVFYDFVSSNQNHNF